MRWRRFRRSRGRWSGFLGVLAVLIAVVALPAVVIQAVRYFQADGPRGQLVRIERNFYGTDDALRIDHVELHAGDKCILGMHSSGVEYLLVFENDERVELQDDAIAVGPTLIWPRRDSDESAPWSPGKTGYARSGDIIAIDLAFDPDQIWEWVTRPYPECERDDIALVVAE